MKNVSLYYKDEKSDKEYHLQLKKTDVEYTVEFQYGRVGSNLTEGTKTPNPVSLNEAEKIFDKILKEKIKKGYIQ